eukprot:1227246-Rhodomonas_salina.2
MAGQPKSCTHNRPKHDVPKQTTGQWKLKLGVIPTTHGSALLTFATLAMLSSSQTMHRFTSVMHDHEPKTLCKAMASTNASNWIKAEHLELRTVWNLGTFKIVDRPKHVAPIPSKFVYKNKLDRDGNICQRKQHLFTDIEIHGDTHNHLDSMPGQHGAVSLGHSGSFHDEHVGHRDIHGLAPRSSALFHNTLEAWRLEYWFTTVGADGVIFKLRQGGESMMLSLYMDDGMCASSSCKLYNQFLQDLSKRFMLSNQGRLAWYLRVAID